MRRSRRRRRAREEPVVIELGVLPHCRHAGVVHGDKRAESHEDAAEKRRSGDAPRRLMMPPPVTTIAKTSEKMVNSDVVATRIGMTKASMPI